MYFALLASSLCACRRNLTSHLHVLFLSADHQDGVQLLLRVGLRGDDEQAVQQIYGDPMRRPAQCSALSISRHMRIATECSRD